MKKLSRNNSSIVQKDISIKITLEGLQVSEINWTAFSALPREARQKYLSDVVGDAVIEIFKNYGMLAYYVKSASENG